MNIAIYSDSFCEIEVEALLADDIQISVQKSSGSSDDLLFINAFSNTYGAKLEFVSDYISSSKLLRNIMYKI